MLESALQHEEKELVRTLVPSLFASYVRSSERKPDCYQRQSVLRESADGSDNPLLGVDPNLFCGLRGNRMVSAMEKSAVAGPPNR